MRAWSVGFGTFLVTGFLALGALAATCGKPASANASAARANASLEGRLAEVRIAMTSGADTSMKCAAILDAQSSTGAGDDATRLCGYEAPLAWAEIHARKLERAPSVASCVHLRDALDALSSHGHASRPEVTSLAASYAKRCGG